MIDWISSKLGRKFMLGTIAGLLTISLLFLIVFTRMFTGQLEQERALASADVNHLLQSALENAMLKRDLDGLRNIVNRLGQQNNIYSVMIFNPEGVVRFASNPQFLGRRYIQDKDLGCANCTLGDDFSKESIRFLVNEQEHEVLRSINPVRNKKPCTQCHGDIVTNPINGILLVDYEAQAIHEKVQKSTLLLMGSGSSVVLFAVAGGWWFMHRFVLAPVSLLAKASHSLSKGQLDTRVNLYGRDELAQLGQAFNSMAENLKISLRDSHEKEVFLQKLIDAIPDGIRVIDSNYSIVQANQSYCDQIQRPMEQVVNTPCYKSSHNRSEPCISTLITCPLREIEKNDKPLKTMHQHIRRDGNELFVEVVAAPLKLIINGEEKQYIIESIRDLAKQLEFSHGQRLATLTELATGVAHEIRNPLASIRMGLQSALRSTEGMDKDFGELRKYLRIVDHEVDVCIDVTERLLKLATPSSDSLQLISLNDAIADTISLLVADASQQGIVVELDLASPDARVMASDSEIRIIVINLAQNAFHAMLEGGHLQILSCVKGDDVQMIFEDTGIGITPEDLPKIFTPFFSHRADGSMGAGLGLSICKTIVQRYGGQIEVETCVDKRTSFTVTLPNADSEAINQTKMEVPS
jgi:signal transduction histidine kinase/HAMP domain-containing protein